MVSEYIDAYSDDQIYLHMLEGLVNAHPVESTSPESIRYSAFSRLWIVMMVGSIECMIKEWGQEYEMARDIFNYFNNGSNEDRIDRLHLAFKLRGIPVQPGILEDYLAIKYIRNAYIHSEWDENQRAYVISRGFPPTLMNFTPEHFESIKTCYFETMQYLGMAKCFNGFLAAKHGLK